MLLAYALNACNQIGFVDLLAKEQILAFVPFTNGSVEMIKLAFDWQTMQNERKLHQPLDHFAVYKCFVAGESNHKPYLQEYLIVDKREKNSTSSECSYKLAHDYIIPEMNGKFYHVDYDADEHILIAAASDALYVFHQHQLIAIIAATNIAVANVPTLVISNLSPILTCKSYPIIKNKIWEVKIVTQGSLVLHRVLIEKNQKLFVQLGFAQHV